MAEEEDVIAASQAIQERCPITMSAFKDPVKNKACGHSYERAAIHAHITTTAYAALLWPGWHALRASHACRAAPCHCRCRPLLGSARCPFAGCRKAWRSGPRALRSSQAIPFTPRHDADGGDSESGAEQGAPEATQAPAARAGDERRLGRGILRGSGSVVTSCVARQRLRRQMPTRPTLPPAWLRPLRPCHRAALEHAGPSTDPQRLPLCDASKAA